MVPTIFLTATEFIADSVYTDPEAAESIASEFSDLATTAGAVTSDFVEKYLSMDFINEILTNYSKLFAVGFAFTTVLVLLTYGVFKAFSLVRIE